MYFANFPKTLFQVSAPSYRTPAQYVALTDIIRNVRFKKYVISNITLYDEYIMMDGETPEMVSEKLYGSPYYHWVIMLLNERFDYVNDFVLSSSSLEEYIDQKYNVIVSGNNYINTVYDDTPQSLLVDIRDAENPTRSIEINSPSVVVVNKTTNATSLVPLISVTHYDATLKMDIKRFMYKSTPPVGNPTGTYLNPLVYRVDFGQLVDYTPVYASDRETELNEAKRKIKVLSEGMLQVTLKNFKDLM